VEELPFVCDNSGDNIGGFGGIQPAGVDDIQEADLMLGPLFHNKRDVLVHPEAFLHPDNEHGSDNRDPELQLQQGPLAQRAALPVPGPVPGHHLGLVHHHRVDYHHDDDFQYLVPVYGADNDVGVQVFQEVC